MTDPPRGAERRRRRAPVPRPVAETTRYRQLENPLGPLELLSADEIAHLHASALEILGRDGIRVLLPEAREVFAAAGAQVDEETELVRFEPELIEQAIASAPSSFELVARSPERTATIGGRSLVTVPGEQPTRCQRPRRWQARWEPRRLP